MEQTSENLPRETWGQAGQETWSDCVSGMCETQMGTCLITGASCCERASVPAVKSSGTGSANAGEACEWSDWEVSITTEPHKFLFQLTMT